MLIERVLLLFLSPEIFYAAKVLNIYSNGFPCKHAFLDQPRHTCRAGLVKSLFVRRPYVCMCAYVCVCMCVRMYVNNFQKLSPPTVLVRLLSNFTRRCAR